MIHTQGTGKARTTRSDVAVPIADQRLQLSIVPGESVPRVFINERETMSPIERTIRSYLNASAGTANIPTNHTLTCFVGMVEAGEVGFEDFGRIGGPWLEVKVREMSERLRKEREGE